MTWSFWGMPHVRHISFCHHRCRKDPLTLTSTKSRTCAFSPSWRVVLKLVPGLDQHHQRWQVSICSLIKGVWSAVAVIFQTYYRTPGDVQFVQNETRDDFAKRSGKISSLMVKQSNITSTGFDWNRAPWFQWSIIISFLKNDHILVIKLNVFESFSDKAVCHRRTHTHTSKVLRRTGCREKQLKENPKNFMPKTKVAVIFPWNQSIGCGCWGAELLIIELAASPCSELRRRAEDLLGGHWLAVHWDIGQTWVCLDILWYSCDENPFYDSFCMGFPTFEKGPCLSQMMGSKVLTGCNRFGFPEGQNARQISCRFIRKSVKTSTGHPPTNCRTRCQELKLGPYLVSSAYPNVPMSPSHGSKVFAFKKMDGLILNLIEGVHWCSMFDPSLETQRLLRIQRRFPALPRRFSGRACAVPLPCPEALKRMEAPEWIKL